jgi:hypothetical protein
MRFSQEERDLLRAFAKRVGNKNNEPAPSEDMVNEVLAIIALTVLDHADNEETEAENRQRNLN